MDSALDVVQFLYGGTGGQLAVGRMLDEGLRRVGLRTGVILHARAEDLVDERSVWPETEVVEVLPRHSRSDTTLTGRLAGTLRRHPSRVLIAHIPYGARAVHRAVRSGELAAAILVEHHSLARRRRRDDLRSARMLGAVSAVVMLTDAYRSGYPLHGRLDRLGIPVAVIPNGVDQARFHPGARPETRDATRDATRGAFRVGMAAAFVDGKDQATLIRAISIARRTDPSIELILMGDGPRRDELQQLVLELEIGGAVQMPGHLAEDDLAVALRGVDVYAHCSEGETQSTAILQAQATGLPVVATHAPGVTDAVAHGVDGILVPAGDADALAAALVDLAADSRRARDLGEAALERVRTTGTLETMVGAYLELLGTVDAPGPWRAARARLGG